jgi:tetratricopeptide (TPR) repeat protein
MAKRPTGNRAQAKGKRSVSAGGGVSGSTLITGDIGGSVIIGQMPGSAPSEPPRLPADLGDFTGREKEIDELTAILRRASGPKVAIICGMGGAGKSALATHAAHLVADEYPDGQVVVDMRGTRGEPKPTATAMQEIAAGFERTVQLPPEPDDAAAEYRRLLSGKRMLLLLDDAADEAQVRPLLALGPPAGFVVTSRRRLSLPGQHRIGLDEMNPAEAYDLLRRIAGPGRATDDELKSVAEQCRRLPLALRVAGTFLDKHPNWSAARYVEALRQERARLRIDGDKDLDVEAVLGFSASRLAATDRALAERWQMLSVFPASFDRPAAAAVWGIADEDEDETLRDLGRLLEQSLLLFDAANERYRLHDLMRPVARNAFGYDAAQPGDFSGSAEPLAIASARHAAHYEAVLAAADYFYHQGGNGVTQGLALFDREWVHIEAGQAWAAERQEQDDGAARLAVDYPYTGATLLLLRLHPRRRVAWLEVALAAARHLGDRRGEGSALGNLGIAYRHLGDTRRAIEHYEQVLAIAREMGDRTGEGKTLGNLGIAYAALGETKRAIEHFEQNLAIAREIGDHRGEGSALGNLGNAYAELGETRRSIEHCEQHLAIAREIGDRWGEGRALGNLGVSYAALGETRRAIEHYEQRLAIAREIRDRHGEATALYNMALSLQKLDDSKPAVEKMKAALVLYEAMELPDAADAQRILNEWGASD